MISLLVGCYHQLVFMDPVNGYLKSKLLAIYFSLFCLYIYIWHWYKKHSQLVYIYNIYIYIYIYIYKQYQLANHKLNNANYHPLPTVSTLCTHNFTCMKVCTKPFYVHKNQCTQILNLARPVKRKNVVLSYSFLFYLSLKLV